MQQVRCVRAHGSHKPGDPAEMPDGAEFSELYFAAEDSPEAEAAVARAAAAQAAEKAAEASKTAGGSSSGAKPGSPAAATGTGTATTSKDGA